MPTGYTAEVQEGKVTDFRTFALRCARAFGATIMQRDDPMADAPKLREESDFYRRSVETDEAQYNRLRAMGTEDAVREARQEYEQELVSVKERRARVGEEQRRYRAMLEQVEAWEPPTPGHQELKDFMAKQLRESMDFDDVSEYIKDPVLKPAEAWLADQLQRAAESLARSRKSLREEQERVAGANEWIRQLYESLGGVPAEMVT